MPRTSRWNDWLARADAMLDNQLGELVAINKLNFDPLFFKVILGGLDCFIRDGARCDYHTQIGRLCLNAFGELLHHVYANWRVWLPMFCLDRNDLSECTSYEECGQNICTLVLRSRHNASIFCT